MNWSSFETISEKLENYLTSVGLENSPTKVFLDVSSQTGTLARLSGRTRRQRTKGYSIGWVVDIQRDKNVSLSSGKLTEMYISLQQLLKDENFSAINLVLWRLDVTRMPADAMVALLRYTFGESDRISRWRDFLNRVGSELRSRRVPVESLLRGLY